MVARNRLTLATQTRQKGLIFLAFYVANHLKTEDLLAIKLESQTSSLRYMHLVNRDIFPYSTSEERQPLVHTKKALG